MCKPEYVHDGLNGEHGLALFELVGDDSKEECNVSACLREEFCAFQKHISYFICYYFLLKMKKVTYHILSETIR